MQYVYKIKHKFVKARGYLERREIEQFGFVPYKADDDEELFYALGVKLKENSDLFSRVIQVVEQIFKHATDEQKQEDFELYNFDKDGKMILSEENKKEFTECQLCFSVNGKFSNVLFINAPDGLEYYDTEILKTHIPDVINFLLEQKVIYKAKSKLEWKDIK